MAQVRNEINEIREPLKQTIDVHREKPSELSLMKQKRMKEIEILRPLYGSLTSVPGGGGSTCYQGIEWRAKVSACVHKIITAYGTVAK